MWGFLLVFFALVINTKKRRSAGGGLAVPLFFPRWRANAVRLSQPELARASETEGESESWVK